jgi:hypothetical protein
MDASLNAAKHFEFEPAFLYLRKGDHTERHLIDRPKTELVLGEGKTLNVRWLSGSFKLCWDDQGVIPRLAKEREKAQDLYDVQVYDYCDTIRLLKNTITHLKTQDQQDPYTSERLALMTKGLEQKKLQQLALSTEFHTVPTGEGWIKNELCLELDEAVVLDLVFLDVPVPVWLVIKDVDSKREVSTRFPCFSRAKVKCTFDPDDDIDVSGETFTLLLASAPPSPEPLPDSGPSPMLLPDSGPQKFNKSKKVKRSRSGPYTKQTPLSNPAKRNLK